MGRDTFLAPPVIILGLLELFLQLLYTAITEWDSARSNYPPGRPAGASASGSGIEPSAVLAVSSHSFPS